MTHEIPLVVPSCDHYSDLWSKFYSLLKKAWPSAREILLLSNEKSSSDMPTLLLGPDRGWCANMASALDKMPEEFMLVMENQFLLEIDEAAALRGWELFLREKDVGALCLTDRYICQNGVGDVRQLQRPVVGLEPSFFRKQFFSEILLRVSDEAERKGLKSARHGEIWTGRSPFGRPIEFEICGTAMVAEPNCRWRTMAYARSHPSWDVGSWDAVADGSQIWWPACYWDALSFGRWRRGYADVWKRWRVSWDLDGRDAPDEKETRF